MKMFTGRTDECLGQDREVTHEAVVVYLERGLGIGLALSAIEAVLQGREPSAVEEIEDLFGVEELRDSALELFIVLARSVSRPSVNYRNLEPSDQTEMVVGQVTDFLSRHTLVSFLLVLAQELESEDHDHKKECGSCESAGGHSPLLARAMTCRDIADELALEKDTELVVHDFATIAALDLCVRLLEVIEEHTGTSPSEHVTDLRSQFLDRMGQEGSDPNG